MQSHPTAPSGPPQPIPMDMTGDLKIDLFGVEPLAPSTFKVWKNVWNVSQPTAPMFELYVFSFLNDPTRANVRPCNHNIVSVLSPNSMDFSARSQILIAMLPLT